jgi:hypothetical protein
VYRVGLKFYPRGPSVLEIIVKIIARDAGFFKVAVKCIALALSFIPHVLSLPEIVVEGLELALRCITRSLSLLEIIIKVLVQALGFITRSLSLSEVVVDKDGYVVDRGSDAAMLSAGTTGVLRQQIEVVAGSLALVSECIIHMPVGRGHD